MRKRCDPVFDTAGKSRFFMTRIPKAYISIRKPMHPAAGQGALFISGTNEETMDACGRLNGRRNSPQCFLGNFPGLMPVTFLNVAWK